MLMAIRLWLWLLIANGYNLCPAFYLTVILYLGIVRFFLRVTDFLKTHDFEYLGGGQFKASKSFWRSNNFEE